jgi:membrane protein
MFVERISRDRTGRTMQVTLLHVAQTAATNWWNDRAMSMGASIAYFAIFSLAPMLLVVIGVAGLAFGAEAAQGAIVAQFSAFIGERAAQAIESMVTGATQFGSGVVGTAIGVISFLLLSTGMLVELQDDLNIIWKVRRSRRSTVMQFLRTRLVSLAMMLVVGFLLLVFLLIDAGLSALGGFLEQLYSGAGVLLHMLNNLLSITAATGLFAMMFKILPDVDIDWQDVWTGALVTALLFTVGKFLIALYLGRSAVASSYGAAGSVVTILLWVYYSSLILLFGAEFTKAHADYRKARLTGSAAAAPPSGRARDRSRQSPATS